MDTCHAMEVAGLVKRYGSVKAVDGISFVVERGEVFGMLGPNGAGKTTTVETMVGLRSPDEGEVRILGMSHRQQSAEIKARIGVQLQTTGMYPTHTVRETIDLFAAFFPDGARVADTQELIDMVGLGEKANSLVKNLSGGQRQRVAVALALVNKPDIVFLDEPTTGLDPQARRAMWDLVLGLKRSGVTVLLTTHYMEEAEQLCDRVAIVDHGKIIEMGAPAALVNKHFKHVAIEFEAPDGTLVDMLREAPGVDHMVAENGRVTVYSVDVPATMAALLGMAGPGDGGAGVSLRQMLVRQASLEDVFLKLTGRPMRE